MRSRPHGCKPAACRTSGVATGADVDVAAASVDAMMVGRVGMVQEGETATLGGLNTRTRQPKELCDSRIRKSESN